MGKHIKLYEVKNLTNVDVSKYSEGSLFKTNRSVGMLVNGSIKTLSFSQPDLKDYVKKEDVRKMIKEQVKE